MEFLRNLFWFLFPWIVLVIGAVVLIPLDTRIPGIPQWHSPIPERLDRTATTRETPSRTRDFTRRVGA